MAKTKAVYKEVCDNCIQILVFNNNSCIQYNIFKYNIFI
jgi:hypothetical protein